jgi:hypothetical protein
MEGEDCVYGDKGSELLHAYFYDNILRGHGADTSEGGKGAEVLKDRSGPGAGRPANVDFVDGASGANSAGVFDGDALDVVCVGGLVQDDPNDSVNPATCPAP